MFVLSFIYLCLSSKTVANLPVSLSFGLFILMRQYGTCYFFFPLWNEREYSGQSEIRFCLSTDFLNILLIIPLLWNHPGVQQAEHCQQNRGVILPLEYLIQIQVSQYKRDMEPLEQGISKVIDGLWGEAVRVGYV